MSNKDALSRSLVEICSERRILIATAESCTGGMIAAAITDVPGSSAAFDRGFVTYSNEAKQDMLGVTSDTLQKFGAVSEQTAIEMAEGALKNSRASIAVSVTGVAGPGGGTPDKPVGLVHLGLASTNKPGLHREFRFGPLERDEIREATVLESLKILLTSISGD